MADLEAIANEIISGSSGSFYLGYSEEYESLSAQDKEAVMKMVWEEIDSCSECGWYWDIHNLEYIEGHEGHYCWQCARDLYEEEEEIDE